MNEKTGKEKSATLVVKLNADSGYSSSEKTRVSVDQWTRISKILNEQ